MLAVYADAFDTVEAHATYRRLPGPAASARWCEAVGDGFRFAPKAHMNITHRRDLDGVEDRVAAFVSSLAPLGERLGPVLVSLPHRQPDLARLDRLIAALAGGPVTAFDLGPAWNVPAVLSRLDAAGSTLVSTDSADGGAPGLAAVGPVAYVRLRRPSYGPAELDWWADRLARAAAHRDVYAFLKHDDDAVGPSLAVELSRRLEVTAGG